MERVINEDIEPAGNFPYGPYPNDKLVYRNDRTVEFRTPPDSEGLGTMSRFRADSLPIHGVAVLSDEMSLVRLAVKLSPDEADIRSHIIRQFERENAAQNE
jgi:hypothetical protein